VQLSAGNEIVAALVKREGDRYLASFSVPRAGEWRLEINSSFLNNRITLLPLQAVKTESAAPQLSMVERGRRFYVAKGCVGCHQHHDAGMPALFPFASDLSAKHYPAETFKRILENPAAALSTLPNRFSQMPVLNLKPAEIEALTAFINADRPSALKAARR
jgi:mono/diheme cytochrome c family protein